MNKLKLFAPFAFFAITLASCNGNNKTITDIPQLDRVSYAETPTFTSLNGVFQGMYDKQFTTYNNETTFNIFKQGVATFQYGVKISGTINISLITDDGRTLVIPINLNDWRINSTGKVTLSWDIDKGYIKVADPYESYYVGIGKSKYYEDADVFLKFYNSPVKGEKYKTVLSYDPSMMTFSDIVLLESLANFTFEIPSLPRLNSINDAYRSIGFDLSGFLFGMGGYSFPMNFLSPGVWGATESVTSTVDRIVALKAIDQLSTKFASNDEKTASIEAKLSDVNLDTYSSLIWIATEGIINNIAGNVNLDYFAAFDDYFVRQQELFLDVLDFDLLALKLSESFLHELANEFASGYKITGGVIEVNDFNFSFHANEDVVKGCVAETYDPTSYTEI